MKKTKQEIRKEKQEKIKDEFRAEEIKMPGI